MAIPIRLVFGDKQVIQIQAQTFDIGVDRKISAFPTPGGLLERYASDTNTPEVKIDIGGIFIDDDINDNALADSTSSLSSITSPSRAIISFNDIMPSDINQPIGTMVSPKNIGQSQPGNFLEFSEYFFTSGSFPLNHTGKLPLKGQKIGTTDGMTAVFGPKIATVKATVSSTVLTVTRVDETYFRDFKAGDKIIDDNKNVVGTVQSATTRDNNGDYNITFTSSVSVTNGTEFRYVRSIFNARNEFIGEVVDFYPSIIDTDQTYNDKKKEYEQNVSQPTRVNNGSGYAAGVTSINVDGRDATDTISVGDNVYTRSRRIGKVTSVSATSIGFSAGTEVSLVDNTILNVEVVPQLLDTSSLFPTVNTLILNASTAVELDSREKIFIGGFPPAEAIFHDKVMILVPSYWQEDVANSPIGTLAYHDTSTGLRPQSILFKFDATQTAHMFTSGVTPYVESVATARSSSDAVVILPIGGISNSSEYTDPTKDVGSSPANNLAKVIKTAIELTTNVVSTTTIGSRGNFTYNDGTTTSRSIAGAFSATVSNGTIVISHKYIPTNKQIDFYNPLAKMPSDFLFSRTVSNGTTKGGKKSAGDKVQDMLGLMSNARKGIDLLRGIQIPYDSLVTSNNVTAAARNFFLTFGEINVNEKGSISNTRPASLPLQGLTELGDGNTVDEDTNFITQALAETLPAVHAFVDFLISTGETIFVTLTSNPHGNDGGIRVIPNKFHVRYDAGHKYYAFSLQLLASDFVIGV